jgi:hypothetical protein
VSGSGIQVQVQVQETYHQSSVIDSVILSGAGIIHSALYSALNAALYSALNAALYSVLH